MPGSGLLAACVPGAFGGWLLLLREYGTLRLRDVLGYAIGYAESGYPLVPAISWSIASVADLFREHWHTSAEVYLPGGGVPAPGSRFANPALAATYQRILAEAEAASDDRDEQLEAARRAWYDGFVAEEIGKFATTEVMDVTGERHRGLLTGHDLATWHARLEAPVSYDYHGLTVCKTGPWGQGPVFLQQLALLSGYDLAAMKPGSAEFIHLVTEAPSSPSPTGRRGTATRTSPTCRSTSCSRAPTTTSGASSSATPRAWSCGPAGPAGENRSCRDSPRSRSGYQTRTATAGARDATGERRPGDRPRHRRAARAVGARAGAARRHLPPRRRRPLGQRGHRDAERRLAAVLAGHPRLGFCLGTRAQMFTLTPGLPATIAPGKRPRTTLTPTLALRDGEPYLAFGTPGGDQQDQWTLGFFLNHVHFGMNLQQAIDFPAFHSAHMPSSFYPREAYPGRLDVESRVGEPVIDELRGAATTCTSSRRGRSAGSARSPATAACSTPPPTPAACRATPPAANDTCHGRLLSALTTARADADGGIGTDAHVHPYSTQGDQR